MTKIEWNKVTWYSKILAAVFFIALPYAGFYLGVQYGKTLAPFLAPPESIENPVIMSAPNYYSTPAEWQTDANNTSGGFSIAYPIDFSAQDNPVAKASAGWRNGAISTGNIYFTLTIPKAFEPQTNFADATLTVGGSKNKAAIAQCLTADPTGGPSASSSEVTIDGISFSVFRSSDAGAGNLYQTTSYRTIHAGQCYAIEYTIHSNQIANYPASYNLKQFNQSKIDVLMQAIIGTFKFE